MNFLTGISALHSVTCFDYPVQISMSPNGRFFCVVTESSVSLWTAEAQQTMVGITIRNKEFEEKVGKNKAVAWDRNGEWIAVLV